MLERKIGILSLDTQFPRIRGDAGNPESYPFAAEVAVVDGADAPRVVKDGQPEEALLARFVSAAQRLEANGASAIVSTCGFLITSQAPIAAAVSIPVMVSALSLYPMIRAVRPGRIGILTASAQALGPEALAAAGIAPDTVAIVGMDDVPAFARTFLVTRTAQPETLDRAAIEAAMVGRARRLVEEAPDIGAILFECGNLPPYAGAVRQATGRPVFHLIDAAIALVSAQAPFD